MNTLSSKEASESLASFWDEAVSALKLPSIPAVEMNLSFLSRWMSDAAWWKPTTFSVLQAMPVWAALARSTFIPDRPGHHRR